MHKRTKKFFKRIINKDKPKPIIYRMRSFAEFYKTLSPEIIAAADKEMEEACKELNHLPPIILMSRDPNDAKHVRKIKL